MSALLHIHDSSSAREHAVRIPHECARLRFMEIGRYLFEVLAFLMLSDGLRCCLILSWHQAYAAKSSDKLGIFSKRAARATFNCSAPSLPSTGFCASASASSTLALLPS